MTLETRSLERAFRYNSVDLADPGAQYSAEEVRDLYTATYPELANAAIEGPEEKDGKLVYTFRRPVGTKGGTAMGAAFIRRLPGGKRIKRCAGCKQDKEISAFTLGSGPGGLHRHCRECCRAHRCKRRGQHAQT